MARRPTGKKWLMRGFTTGDPNKCDTFAADAL